MALLNQVYACCCIFKIPGTLGLLARSLCNVQAQHSLLLFRVNAQERISVVPEVEV